MSKPSLEWLVDDYLSKHEACVQAGHLRELAMRANAHDTEIETLTSEFIRVHNERAAAFRALKAARQP